MDYLIAILVIGALIFLAIQAVSPWILKSAARAGAEIRVAPTEHLKKIDFCLFGIGAISHDGGADLLIYDDGIGVTLNTIHGEIFFRYEDLKIEPAPFSKDSCKFSISSRKNGKEIFFPSYIRQIIVDDAPKK